MMAELDAVYSGMENGWNESTVFDDWVQILQPVRSTEASDVRLKGTLAGRLDGWKDGWLGGWRRDE